MSFVVAGVALVSVSVSPAGGDRPIVVLAVVMPAVVNPTAKPNNGTAKPKKAKKPTVLLKTAVVSAKSIPFRKIWMMPLQVASLFGV